MDGRESVWLADGPTLSLYSADTLLHSAVNGLWGVLSTVERMEV